VSAGQGSHAYDPFLKFLGGKIRNGKQNDLNINTKLFGNYFSTSNADSLKTPIIA
jgi:hypothetical protein